MSAQTQIPQKLIVVIGGTGAQGVPVVEALSNPSKSSPAYRVRVLTRDPTNAKAQALGANPNVELLQGSVTNEDDLNRAFEGAYGAFVNVDGFEIGEKAELFWGIRSYEISRLHGVTHFVWGHLDYNLPLTGWKNRVGHYDGKARVGRFISTFPSTPEATWSLLTTGPYTDTLSEFMLPRRDADGTYVFNLPLGENGHVPMIALDDVGFYGRWLFDHPEESSGLELKAVTDMVSGEALAKTFTKVTGKPARFNNISLEDYFASFPNGGEARIAPEDPSSMTWKQNFAGFWKLYQNNIVKRDFAFVDRIHPQRLTLETWMVKAKYDGEPRSVLKGWKL